MKKAARVAETPPEDLIRAWNKASQHERERFMWDIIAVRGARFSFSGGGVIIEFENLLEDAGHVVARNEN
jgi:hypothetical protein